MSDFKAKMHQNAISVGPDPAGGAHSAPQTVAEFKGLTSKGWNGRGGEKRKGSGGKGR